jgi:haloacid dehalogenase-like hydrolase
MYCRVIACDFDGTGAVDGHPAPELYAALAAARAQGIVTLLVTGRVLEDVQRACEELSPFDGMVAENGAIIHLCGLGRTIQVGKPPSEHFLGELRAQGVPFHTGSVIVGTWEQHTNKLLELVRRFGIDGQLIFNRAALMLLPSGINKAVGIRRALDALGRSERNLIGLVMPKTIFQCSSEQSSAFPPGVLFLRCQS